MLNPTDLIRHRLLTDYKKGKYVKVEGEELVNLTSNDYLGMSQHPEVRHAFMCAVKKYGVGSGASALVSGFSTHHSELEQRFAELLKRDQAIIFSSGYLANLAVMSTLGNKHTTFIADKLCHASLIDGMRLSGGKIKRYKHLDYSHCHTLIRNNQTSKVLVTESVFSMSGNIAPVKELIEICSHSNTFLLIDDAHGFGVLGENGLGICDYLALNQQTLSCIIIPFGKSIGTMGAAVIGSDKIINTLIQHARSYCYTTSLPPALASATLTALNCLTKETWRLKRLQVLIKYFLTTAQSLNVPLLSQDETPIQAVLVKENLQVLTLQKYLKERGLLVSAIRPPTVPKNTARIRISLNCYHQKTDILRLLFAIKNFYEK